MNEFKPKYIKEEVKLTHGDIELNLFLDEYILIEVEGKVIETTMRELLDNLK